MLHLITGTPGSGKTLYAVSLIMSYHKQNLALLEKGLEPRTIYADIDGLDIEGVEPAPDDWRDTPDGSIIFYDEIQQRDVFKKAKGDNDIVNALQVHRHTGHDIYGITQFPILLHANFNAVVGIHWHLHRGWGLSAATVYQWAYCVTAPNTPSNKNLAENSFRFNYPKDLFKYYKSATVHTHKARIPKKFLFIIVFILFGMFFVYKVLFKSDNFLMNTVTGKSPESAQSDPADSPVLPQSDPSIQSDQSISDKQQISDLQQDIDTLKQKYLPAHIVELIKSDELIPVSVVSYRDTCIATNRYGERLNLDHSLCLMMISDPTMMPKSRTSNDSNTSVTATPATTTVDSSPEPKVQATGNPFDTTEQL
ncbi:zonular occludens toxin domain-containing protein [Psychrobacter sp.]|uniref:zonular occludens toxin domain-containing protein n=1 Tax=Psychrobacter sp. TaxID=56811 RepID=UPI003C731EDA